MNHSTLSLTSLIVALAGCAAQLAGDEEFKAGDRHIPALDDPPEAELGGPRPSVVGTWKLISPEAEVADLTLRFYNDGTLQAFASCIETADFSFCERASGDPRYISTTGTYALYRNYTTRDPTLFDHSTIDEVWWEAAITLDRTDLPGWRMVVAYDAESDSLRRMRLGLSTTEFSVQRAAPSCGEERHCALQDSPDHICVEHQCVPATPSAEAPSDPSSMGADMCNDSCVWNNDGVCDVPAGHCAPGTDCTDCAQ